MAARNSTRAKKRPQTIDRTDIRDRLRNACDVIQTVCDAITSDGKECECAAMVLSLYALEPLLALKQEIAGHKDDDLDDGE